MALTTISPETQQKLAVFVPLIALGVSLFVVYPAWGRYSELNGSIEKSKRELADLKATPPPPRFIAGKATEADTVTEPAEFLGLLKRLAVAAGCELLSADVSPKEGAKGDGGPVRPVQAHVTVVGQYRQVRSFLWQLEHAGRLLAVAEITLSPVSPQGPGNQPAAMTGGVQAVLTVERYVSPKDKA